MTMRSQRDCRRFSLDHCSRGDKEIWQSRSIRLSLTASWRQESEHSSLGHAHGTDRGLCRGHGIVDCLDAEETMEIVRYRIDFAKGKAVEAGMAVLAFFVGIIVGMVLYDLNELESEEENDDARYW